MVKIDKNVGTRSQDDVFGGGGGGGELPRQAFSFITFFSDCCQGGI